MNDATPRHLAARNRSGSLVERAAAMWDLAPPPVAAPAAALREPKPAPTAFGPVADPVAPRIRTAAPAHDVAPSRHRAVVAVDRARLKEQGMIQPGGAVTALAEEFRQIKRNLLLTAREIAGDKSRTILVCSARPNDGKTFCAINLALSLAAEKDFEILLVDADFAKPDVLASFDLEACGLGLLDAIADPSIDVESCIVDTDIPQLAILSAGTKSHSDTELLGSEAAAAVLHRLATANPRRIVVFDSAPALAASPAAVLAGHVGQVMLVVRADATSENDLRDAVSLLDGCEHVQLVLNAVAFQPGGRRFDGYYGQEAAA